MQTILLYLIALAQTWGIQGTFVRGRDGLYLNCRNKFIGPEENSNKEEFSKRKVE
jgi:hypothetical protein